MELRVLRYFLAVCQEGTMSKAADVLHVTQPTLSRQIADLERELGCELLERHSRSVTPTERGLYLRRRAEELVGLADQTVADLARNEDIVEGDVWIGAGESEAMRVIADRIRAFRELYPRVHFHIHSGDAADVVERLEHGTVDFAVLMSYPEIDRYDHVRLAPTDAWGVLMPEGDPLAQKETVSPADLAGLPLIASEQAHAAGGAVKIPRPAHADMLVQRARLVLSQHRHIEDTRVNTIGQRKIDNAVLAPERHGRLGAPGRQYA